MDVLPAPGAPVSTYRRMIGSLSCVLRETRWSQAEESSRSSRGPWGSERWERGGLSNGAHAGDGQRVEGVGRDRSRSGGAAGEDRRAYPRGHAARLAETTEPHPDGGSSP